MPSERFVAALTEQIDREFAASHQYLGFAAYYDAETFPRLAQLFHAQAEEERGHALKMVRYLLDSGAQPHLGEIAAPRDAFEDHVEPIRLALDQERSVTVEIGKLVEIARETRDHASEVFLHWFVQEQVEEEASMEALLQVAERTRELPMMLEDYVARDGAKPAASAPPAGD
jgi:ferritin